MIKMGIIDGVISNHPVNTPPQYKGTEIVKKPYLTTSKRDSEQGFC